MEINMSTNGFWGGLGVGCASTFALVYLGPAAMTSGWTSAISGAGLAAASASLVLVRAREARDARDERSARILRGVGRPPCSDLLQARDSVEWLREAGCADTPDADLRGFLKARLSGSLTPLTSKAWPDMEEYPANPVGLLALAFAVQAIGSATSKRDDARRLLEGLASVHYLDGRTERDAALAVIRTDAMSLMASNPRIAKVLDRCVADHAHRETFMLGLLAAARKRGVLGSAEFLWLKDVDRGLWYALTSLGRRKHYVEGLAAMDHYRHEVAAGRALPKPRVDGAVEVLMQASASMRAGSGA